MVSISVFHEALFCLQIQSTRGQGRKILREFWYRRDSRCGTSRQGTDSRLPLDVGGARLQPNRTACICRQSNNFRDRLKRQCTSIFQPEIHSLRAGRH